MTILQMRYVYEVAKTKSMNKAAENLKLAQPNISRQIRALEEELGITIFERSTHGIRLTARGEEFVGYAKGVLDRFDAVQKIYDGTAKKEQRFSVCLPRATYLSEAFTDFTVSISGTTEPVDIYYNETNSSEAVKNVASSAYNLGIVRTAATHERYFLEMFDELRMSYEMISEFTFILVMSRKSPLAALEEIHYSDLAQLVELAHADPYVPTLPYAEIRSDVFHDIAKRRIFVFERGSQFELLAKNTETFMWVSPIPDNTLERFELVQRPCVDNFDTMKDILICRKNYELSEYDRLFISKVKHYKEKYLEPFNSQ